MSSFGAVGMVLLVGCMNIAGLMRARVAARRHEIATRMALGGGTMAVMRQFLTESVALALVGGVAGTVLGYGGLKGFELLGQERFGVSTNDLSTFGSVAVCLVAIVGVASFLPALRVARLNPAETLRSE